METQNVPTPPSTPLPANCDAPRGEAVIPPKAAPRARYETPVYYALAAALVSLFYGEFLFTDRVGILDWSKDLYYFAFLHDALRSFSTLPVSFLHIPDGIRWFSTLQDASYWSNPEVISLSPFMALAFVLPLMPFIKAVLAAHLAIAAWGVRLFADALGWSLSQAAALLILFLGNPWLVQHLAIGYSPQISLCLVPVLAALLVRREFGPLAWGAACLVNALILYQGALHLFVWTNLAIAVYAAAKAALDRRLPALFRASALFVGSFILVAPKIHAVRAVYGAWQRIPGDGYASLAALWGLLTDADFPMFDFPETYSHYGVAFYDASILVGPVFCLAAVWLALDTLAGTVFRPGRPDRQIDTTPVAAIMAAAVFLVLGWGTVWRELCRFVPLLASEIYPFRYLLPALAFLFFLMAHGLGRPATNRTGRFARIAILAALIATTIVFYQRNRQLMPALTETPDFIGAFSLAEYYKDRITAFSGPTRLPVAVTPNRVTIIPSGTSGEQIELPWLPRAALPGSGPENARPVGNAPGEAAVIETTRAASPVAVIPRDHDRTPLLAAAAVIFAAMLGVSTVLAGRRNRRDKGMER